MLDTTNIVPRAFGKVEYLDWIKRRAIEPGEVVEWGLALSGMPDPDPLLFTEVMKNLPIFGANQTGWKPWIDAISQRYNVPDDCIVANFGTSQANYLAIAAVAGPGDNVLVEYPTYEPLIALPQGLGCEVSFIERRRDNNWRLDLDELREAVKSDVRLMILANPHNPTGVFYNDEEIREIAGIVASGGGYLLVDEVYREAVPGYWKTTSFGLAKNILITTSLTKVFGLSTLRAGWLIAPPAIAHAASLVHDRLAGRSPLITEELSARVMNDPVILEQCGLQRHNRLTANRATMQRVATKYHWDVVLPETSLTVFVKHPQWDSETLVVKARSHGILVTPGRFFGYNDRVRIAFTSEPETFERLLNRLAEVLA